MTTTETTDWRARHAAAAERRARMVHDLASAISDNPVGQLMRDTSGYGEGGWNESAGELDHDDAFVIALSAWYQMHGLPVPDGHVLHQEARHLQENPPRRAAPANGELYDLHVSLDKWDGWALETSADPDRYTESAFGDRPGDPAGQADVTALLVQETCGGDIVTVTVADTYLRGFTRRVRELVHYFNVLSDGTEVDLTRRQYSEYRPGQNVTEPQLVDRDELLARDDVAARYAALKDRIR